MSAEFACGSMQVYTAGGVLVTLPVPGVPFDYIVAFENVAAALRVGFLATAPGLGAGEQKEEIGYVVKRTTDNRDGGVTPVLDLYLANDAAKFAVLTVYLNTPEDVAAFETASGLRLASISAYIGDNKIERGKKRELDKLVAKSPRPFGVVYVANSKYDEKAAEAARAAGNIYSVPKRKFVRWADGGGKPAPTASGPAGEQTAGPVGNVEFDALSDGIADAKSMDALEQAVGDANRVHKRLTGKQSNLLADATRKRKAELSEELVPF